MSNENLWSNLLLFVYTILWLLLYKKQRGRGKSVKPVSVILLSYAVYSICSIVIYNTHMYIPGVTSYNGLRLLPFIYLFISLIAFLYPAIVYEKLGVSYVQKPSCNLVSIVLITYVVCRLILIPQMINMTKEGMVLLFASEDGGAYLYEFREDYMDQYENKGGIIVSMAGVYTSFLSDIFYFLFFYYLTLNNKRKWLVILAIFAIVLDIISPFGYGNRTDPVMVLFAVIMAATLFFGGYNSKLKKTIKIAAIIGAIIVAVPMAILSMSRFMSESSDTILTGTVGYVGQGNLNFNQLVWDTQDTRHGDRIMNLYKGILGFKTTNGVIGTRDKYSQMKIGDELFSTYVGDMVLDFGKFGTAIIILVSVLLFLALTKPRDHTILFHQLLLLYFILCVAMKGGFYLFPYAYGRAAVFISYIFFYVLFSIDYSMKNKDKSISFLSLNSE